MDEKEKYVADRYETKNVKLTFVHHKDLQTVSFSASHPIFMPNKSVMWSPCSALFIYVGATHRQAVDLITAWSYAISDDLCSLALDAWNKFFSELAADTGSDAAITKLPPIPGDFN
jgi:hypothetical protein